MQVKVHHLALIGTSVAGGIYAWLYLNNGPGKCINLPATHRVSSVNRGCLLRLMNKSVHNQILV